MRLKKNIPGYLSMMICLVFILTGTGIGTENGIAEAAAKNIENEDPSDKPASNEKAGWKLTFEDTFDGDEIDYEKWSHSPEWKRKDGYWSDDEAFVDGNGHLIIQISERDGEYYSGAVTTRDKFEQAYGYYEMRAKLPKEEGFWSAFWLMTDGVHDVGNEGKDGTEIDIFETPFAYRNDDTIGHALHWDGYEEDHQSVGKNPQIPGIYEGYHTFALEWNEDEYIFYVDDEETWRTSAGGISEVPSFVQITAEVGEWGGNVENANLPDQLMVDYVRVYEADPYTENKLKELVSTYATAGEIANDHVVQLLQTHLSAISHYEKKQENEKVLKHLGGFKHLLNYQKEKGFISEEAFGTLANAADLMVKHWKK